MKARYQYRFYSTDPQKQSLAQLFGCVRVVWNDALALCKQSEKKPKSAELQKNAAKNINPVGIGHCHNSKRTLQIE
jgi:transposase